MGSLFYLDERFGEVLRDYRVRQKISQMELAARAGLHINAVSNLERGYRSPKLETVFRLCEALKVAPSEFVGEVAARLPKSKKS